MECTICKHNHTEKDDSDDNITVKDIITIIIFPVLLWHRFWLIGVDMYNMMDNMFINSTEKSKNKIHLKSGIFASFIATSYLGIIALFVGIFLFFSDEYLIIVLEILSLVLPITLLFTGCKILQETIKWCVHPSGNIKSTK